MDELRRRYGLGQRRWRELEPPFDDGSSVEKSGSLAKVKTLLLVPLGACEQHGPHLPFATDTMIASAVAYRACAHLDGDWHPLVAPPLAIAASGEHTGFAGTLSIGTEATAIALVELVRSADWFDRLVFVNGHGGNTVAVRTAVEQSHRDGRTAVSAWSPTTEFIDVPPGDLHAGWIETSVMMHLHPELVDENTIHPGPESVDVATLLRQGVAAVAPNGVLGDPTGANPEAGRAMVDAWVSDLCAHVGVR